MPEEVPEFVPSMIDHLAEKLDAAAVTRLVTSVPWDDENVLHVLLIFYFEGRPPVSLVGGRIRKEGRKWRANRVNMFLAQTQALITFEDDWSDLFVRQGDAISWCGEGLMLQGEYLMDEGSRLMQDPAFGLLSLPQTVVGES